ncbi:MAG: metal-sulfur cluster assembly factor [Usitatibacter sp.]
MEAAPRFQYTGDISLAPLVTRALHRVVDPEMAIDVVELGLVYGVDAAAGVIGVRITMTSAACPVTELIVDEVERELVREFGETTRVEVVVVWEPPWDPEMMSDSARTALGWD